MPKHKKKDNPVCPLCKKKMYVVKYVGYYDSFFYWECSCREEDLKPLEENTWRGSYA